MPYYSGIDTGKQLQAFECLIKLNDETNAAYKDIIQQEQYVELKCVHQLKQIGYKFSLQKFVDYDKLLILKKVWASHANSPIGLEVITNICIGYDIYIAQIWNGVLKQMVALNMVLQSYFATNINNWHNEKFGKCSSFTVCHLDFG